MARIQSGGITNNLENIKRAVMLAGKVVSEVNEIKPSTLRTRALRDELYEFVLSVRARIDSLSIAIGKEEESIRSSIKREVKVHGVKGQSDLFKKPDATSKERGYRGAGRSNRPEK